MREKTTLNEKLCMRRVGEVKGHSQIVALGVGRSAWRETNPGKRNGSGTKIPGTTKDLKCNYKRDIA